MNFLKSPIFYIVILFAFLVTMAIRQQINDKKEYYTLIKVVFKDGSKKELKLEGCPNMHLSKGDLAADGITKCSNVNSFDWNVYRVKY